jgi:hypothetical protein
MPNGPAIKGGCVPAFFPKKRDGALFAVFALRSLGEEGPGTNFIEHYSCRGTNLNASHIFIHGYKFNALQWRGPHFSRFTNLYK